MIKLIERVFELPGSPQINRGILLTIQAKIINKFSRKGKFLAIAEGRFILSIKFFDS